MEKGSKDKTSINQSLAYQSPTFGKDASFVVDEAVGSASISPSGRDVVLASQEGLHIIDLDVPFSPPRHLIHRTPWEVADVQWSPFAAKDYWVCSTSNQKALVWNLDKSSEQDPIEHILHAHTRAITDINFSAHHAEILSTCAVDGQVHCWDLRATRRPAISFCDWLGGATQVKHSRQNPHILASSHDRFLHIWDDRRGNLPLKSIEAHETKIYGIDWNRIRANIIITCSLDKTIKFWDYSKTECEPNRIIKTSYPVWRARHTPFGWGVLAMPQRGNYDLHLYDSRHGEENLDDGTTKPVHSFVGHENQVKEFLWRTRNTIEDSIDKRDFQLVTWGTDRNLRLHRVEDKHLELVGHKRNALTDDEYNLTRKGAIYKTFKDERLSQGGHRPPKQPPAQGLSTMFRGAISSGIAKGFKSTTNTSFQLPETDRAGMNIKSTGKKHEDQITWMKGVKILKYEEDSPISLARHRETSISMAPWEKPESLGDEIVHVGDKFKNVTFDHIDMPARFSMISLNGPWGVDRKFVYIKLLASFPDQYPEMAPDFRIEKTSSIPKPVFDHLGRALREISESCLLRRRGCLEPVFVFLLGEQDLNETISWIENDQNGLIASSTSRDADTSSDEEDDLGAKLTGTNVGDMDASAAEMIDPENSNVNVPLAKACGALWADDGRLICFFPRREEKQSIIAGLAAEQGDRSHRTHGMFGGYGRLYTTSTKPRRRNSSSSNESAPDLSGSFSSSLGSSSSDENLDTSWNLFQNPARFRGLSLGQPRVRSMDMSHQSSGAIGNNRTTNGGQNIVLHRLDDLLPSRKQLAEEYRIYGHGPDVCNHNASVASKYGMHELEEIWRVCSLILSDDVPLDYMPELEGEDVLVLARRGVVSIKRRDSGLDLKFDGPDNVVKPKIRGRVKWGQHPLAGAWLVGSLFDYFEKRADVQMLAMLSCIFSEPAAEPTSRDTQQINDRGLIPMPFEAPAFSYNYFPSEEVALAYFQFHDRETDASRPLPSPSPLETPSGTMPDPFLSWSVENQAETPSPQPYPKLSSPLSTDGRGSGTSSLGQSLKESPNDYDQRAARRSNPSLSNSFAASFSSRLPFLSSASSSPPNFSEFMQRRSSLSSEYPASIASNSFGGSGLSNEIPARGLQAGRSSSLSHHDEEMRTSSSWDRRSAQTRYEEDLLTSGRWSRLREPSGDSLSGSDFTIIEGNSSFTEEAIVDMEPEPPATVILKNQHLFDDEGYASIPLLHSKYAVKLNAYREAYAHLLFVWGLNDTRCEVLKFNGLTPYFIDTEVRPTGTAIPQLDGDDDFVGARDLWQGFKLMPNLPGRLQCSICSESVDGLHKACLKCGHVSHMACLTMWLESQGEEEEHECESGCGCICTLGPTASNMPLHTYIAGDWLMSPLGLGARVDEWGQLLQANEEWSKAGGRIQSRIAPSQVPDDDLAEEFAPLSL